MTTPKLDTHQPRDLAHARHERRMREMGAQQGGIDGANLQLPGPIPVASADPGYLEEYARAFSIARNAARTSTKRRQEERNRFLNYYDCPCGECWTDASAYTNNDKCPACNAEIEPYKSEDI